MFPMDPLTSWLFIILLLAVIALPTWAAIEVSRNITAEDETCESLVEPGSPDNEEIYDWSHSGL